MGELETYLRKCELEWRAKNIPGGCCVDWLAPACDSLDSIAEYLRELGFKIREIVDEGDRRWVVTTGGIVVFQNIHNVRGFVCRG